MKSLNIFTLCVLLSFSLLSHAENDSFKNTQKNPFLEIQEMYKMGTSVPFSKVTGYYSGRCYRSVTPTKAENSLLVGFTEVEDSQGGPLYPPTEIQKLGVIRQPSDGPDFFDKKSKKETQEIVRPLLVGFDSVQKINGDIVGISRRNNTQYWPRKSGDYLVMLLTTVNTLDQTPAGTVFGSCYYFKKLQ